jgi:hypothetical protein
MDADGAISDDICADEPGAEEMWMGEEEEDADGVAPGGGDGSGAGKKRVARPSAKRTSEASTQDHFVGEPIPDGEARQRWPERYAAKVAKVTIPCLTAVPASDSLMSDQHVLSW